MAKSSLLTPDDHSLLLIDHQYLQLLALRSHTSEAVVNNTTFLAKAAKLFKVPTLLTTAFAERQELFQEVQAVFPDQKPIDRSGLNSWDDPRVLDWVKKTGKKKLVMAGLWTEVCLSMPVIDALADGYEVYIVTDAAGGGSTEGMSAASSAWSRLGRSRLPPSPTCPNFSVTGRARPQTTLQSCSPSMAAASVTVCAGNGSCWP